MCCRRRRCAYSCPGVADEPLRSPEISFGPVASLEPRSVVAADASATELRQQRPLLATVGHQEPAAGVRKRSGSDSHSDTLAAVAAPDSETDPVLGSEHLRNEASAVVPVPDRLPGSGPQAEQHFAHSLIEQNVDSEVRPEGSVFVKPLHTALLSLHAHGRHSDDRRRHGPDAGAAALLLIALSEDRIANSSVSRLHDSSATSLSLLCLQMFLLLSAYERSRPNQEPFRSMCWDREDRCV